MNDRAAQRYATEGRNAGCPPEQLHNFAVGNYVAQPRQLRFHAAARQADQADGPDEIGIGGARGGGKSHAVMAQLVHDDCQRQPRLKALFLRSVAKSARESFEDLISNVCPQYYRHYQPGNGRILFPNQSKIILGGFRTESDIGKYLGIEYDVIAVEETTLLTWDTYRKLLGSRRTSKPHWRERLYSTTNPGGVGHAWYKQRFIEPWRKQRQDYTRFIFATYRDNAYISDTYIRYLDSLTGWLGKAWRDGDWDIAAGQFFTTWDHGAHVIEPFPTPRSWRVWLAMDYGYQHYTVWHLFGQSGDGEVYVIDERAARQTSVRQHADAVKAMLHRHRVPVYRLDTIVAGADVFAKRGSETTIAQKYEDAGLTLEPAQMDRINGAANILDYLGDPRNGRSPRVRIMDRCTRLIACLPALQHDPKRPEDVLKVDIDDEGRGGDDAYDAFRYGLMEAPQRDTAGAIQYA